VYLNGTSDLSTGERAAGALTEISPNLAPRFRMSRAIFAFSHVKLCGARHNFTGICAL
jgi:hypothetical protein